MPWLEKKPIYDIFIINCMQIIEIWAFVLGSFDRCVSIFRGMKHTLEGSSPLRDYEQEAVFSVNIAQILYLVLNTV